MRKMNSIEKLIAEKCNGDVPFYELGELGEFFGGLTGKSKTDFVDGNAIFISYKNVYSNPALNITPNEYVKINDGEKQRTLEYGDIVFTGSSETPDECGFSSVVTTVPNEPIYLNSFCFFFRFNDLKIIEPEYAKHLFRSSDLRKQISRTAAGVTRYNVSKEKMKKVRIPLPPIEIQREIVDILDSFTQVVDGLRKELDNRKKQYEYYLNYYFDNQTENIVSLSEIGTLTRGKRFVHADAVEEGIACIHYGELYTYYGVYANWAKSRIREELRPKMRYAHKGDVIIVGAGENNIDIGVGVAWDGEEDVAVHDACYTLTHSQNSKYISYYLRSNIYHNQIKRYVAEGKICSISADGIGRAKIPVPPLEEQKRIVDILDTFDEICNNKEHGLQAEIVSREKQYIYYRDLLLEFREK